VRHGLDFGADQIEVALEMLLVMGRRFHWRDFYVVTVTTKGRAGYNYATKPASNRKRGDEGK
jgi:hypothetical protein